MNCSKAGWVSWPASFMASSSLRSLSMSFMRCMASGVISCMAPDIWLK